MATASSRLTIAVLFGGRSSEHDVSVRSATNVVAALAPEKYDVVPVFVTRAGRWLLSRFDNGVLSRPEQGVELALLPGGRGTTVAVEDGRRIGPGPKLDALFPVLHGPGGEDGSVQGAAEVARIPLIGCGILGSATALDKIIAKRLFLAAGLPVARSATIGDSEDAPDFPALERQLGLPVFIKPARQGSSVGVGKVSTREEFDAALVEGFRYDQRLIAEEFIRGREIEFAVFGDPDDELFVSCPGEIVPAGRHDFYSYDAKYVDQGGAELKVPAELPPEVETAMKDVAAKAFRALGCDGMARVDFFLTADMRFYVNEVNTIPGFTDISMYPMAMAASGVGCSDVMDRLVAHGLRRAAIARGP